MPAETPFTYNDRASMNVDFLIGVGVFLMAFLFLAYSIPGIFIPYQTNSVDLGSVIYRTSCILAEDPGWYTNTSVSPARSDISWEDQENLANVTRIGLAVDKTIPNVLSKKKIAALNKSISYDLSRDKLGLNNSIVYDYNLTIEKMTPSGNMTLLLKGPTPGNYNVEYMERNVLIDEGKRLLIDGAKTTGNSNLELIVDPLKKYDNNVTITIQNSTGTAINFGIQQVMTAYNITFPSMTPDKFKVYKNGVLQPVAGNYYVVTYDSDDVIDLVIPGSTIKDMSVIRMIIATSMSPGSFPSGAQYFEETNPYYWSLYSPGILKLKVWSW
ncbi:hypothetical protein CUJ83_03895 [Methanocella sp. CWC-04]|uniref:Uncharacterized protein n=1 Tax=Methanooceanicella nereidis TaxID=2052831 RepID=A0AAP2W4D6_9EURY|nr:hypothetical protein [Methanocella sp. CWC-04]MCD1294135.1 hypothetical protein [Methanocella sp. CWC-04]